VAGDDQTPSLLIVGFGNPMMGDDGIGPAVVGCLSCRALPASVDCRELSDVLHLPAIWSGHDEVWMVDAVIGGAPPGTLHRVSLGDDLPLADRSTTSHHLDLVEGLSWVRHGHPEMNRVRFGLWGVEPQTVVPMEGLSKVVEDAVHRLTDEIMVAIHDQFGASESIDS
jgi:hydrogenase maturation protease